MDCRSNDMSPPTTPQQEKAMLRSVSVAVVSLVLSASTLPAGEWFVDPQHGDDHAAGTLDSPYRTLQHAVQHAQPGDTITLRGGEYLEQVTIERMTATADRPLIIRGMPGETAILEAGLPQFRRVGNDDWEPVPDGAPHEWRSKMQVPPSAHVGRFLDSDIRLLLYSNANDFRADNQLSGYGGTMSVYDTRPGAEVVDRRTGESMRHRHPWVYYGPGLFFNEATGHVHIRLSPTDVVRHIKPYYSGEDDPRRPREPRAIARQTEVFDYQGPTDPRQLALGLASAQPTLIIQRSRHLTFRNLVIRNRLNLAANEHITFEDVRFLVVKDFGRFGGDRFVRFLHCEFEGGMPPWVFRADFKGPYSYRDPDGDVVVNDKVRWTNRTLFSNYGTRDLEVAFCEFRNAHDVYFAGVNTRIHHSLIEDIHDDALFVSYPDEIENMHIHQNVVRRSLMGMAFHGNRAGVSRYVYRNIIDLRAPARSGRPNQPSDHGYWAWRSLFIAKTGQIGPMSVYQNTLLIRNHETILGGLQFPTPDNPRRLFNNIFVSLNPDMPIVTRLSPAYPAQIDGNLWHRVDDDGSTPLITGFADLYAYRNSDDYQQSKAHYPPGWFNGDVQADPGFVRFHGESRPDDDLRLSEMSAARHAGVPLPDHLEDPLRPADNSRPDIGALPFGSGPMRVGRHGRFSFPDGSMVLGKGAVAPKVAAAETAAGEAEDDDDAEAPAEAVTLSWTGAGGDGAWSSPANWRDGLMPVPTEVRPVQLELGAVMDMTLDRDQQLRGGLSMAAFRGSVRLDLGGHRMTFAGGKFIAAGTRNSPVIRNGTLVLGVEGRPTDLRVFDQVGDDQTFTLADDVRIEAGHMGELALATAAGNRTAKGVFDLSAAKLIDDRMTMRRLVIAAYEGLNTARGSEGTLKLPATLRRLETAELAMAINHRAGGTGQPSFAKAAIDFGGGAQLDLRVTGQLTLAIGDNTAAAWTNLPRRLNITIGNDGAPGIVRIAYKDRSQGKTDPPDQAATAELLPTGGSFTAHLAELRVGHNTQSAGGAHGVLDLSASTMDTLKLIGEPDPGVYYRPDMTRTAYFQSIEQLLGAPIVAAGAMIVGVGHGATGTVRLPAGAVEAAHVFVGDAAEGSKGTLELLGSTLTVRRALTIGQGGQVTARIAAGGGIRILGGEPNALSIDKADDRAGRLRLVIADAAMPVIALRIAGDHEAKLRQYLQDGRIVIESSTIPVGAFVIYRDGGDTVLGARGR